MALQQFSLYNEQPEDDSFEKLCSDTNSPKSTFFFDEEFLEKPCQQPLTLGKDQMHLESSCS